MITRRLTLAGLLSAPAILRAQPLPVLKIGDQKGGARALMEAAGVLAGAPFTVEWSLFAGAPMLLEALNAGAIDLGGIGDAPFTSAVAAGIPMKAVSAVRSDGAVTAVVVPGASPIRDVAGLKGRRIATLRGQTGHFLVLAALRQAGMTPADVHFVFIAPAEAKAAMASGAVDAWATWGPYISLAKLSDGAREIVNGRDLMSGQSYQVAGNAAIAGKRAAVGGYLRRLRLAYEWGLANPDKQAQVWCDQTGFPLPVGRDVVNVARTHAVPIDDAVVAAQQRVGDFFHESRVIPEAQDVAGSFDRSFNAAIFGA